MTTKFAIRILSLLTAVIACVPAIMGHGVNALEDGDQDLRPSKVVMILLTATSLQDWLKEDMPTIRNLMDEGAVGLMNSRTAGRRDKEQGTYSDGRYTPESGYVTIGAGCWALAGKDARQTFNRDEPIRGVPAGIVLKRLTGIKPGSAEVVNVCIAGLAHTNSGANRQVSVGLLGDALHKNGLLTAAVGNTDDMSLHREIATICMDSSGLVDFGNVSRTINTTNSAGPQRVITNPEKFLTEARRCISQASFTVLEIGDLARLDRLRLDLMDDIYLKQKSIALHRMDAILGDLLKFMDMENTIIIITTPYPSSWQLSTSGSSLCPILVTGKGIRHGLLSSNSTRVDGVVANIDITASVLHMLGITIPSEISGRPIHAVPGSDPNNLTTIQNRIVNQSAAWPVLSQSAVVTIILVTIVTIIILLLSAKSAGRKKVFNFLVLLPPALAPSMLILTLFPTCSQALTWVGLTLTTIILTLLALLIGKKPIWALMLISLAFSMALIIDIGAGGNLTRHSIMSYSIMEGSRYYGIGNEFMGALLGSSLIGTGLMLGVIQASEKMKRIFLLCVLILVATFIGFPMMGANAGGAIAAIITFGLALVAFSSRPVDIRKIIMVAIAAAAIIAAFSCLDFLRGQGHESHFGRAIGLVKAGGLEQVGIIIRRKLSMNLLLIQVSVWSRLVIAYIVSMAMILGFSGTYNRIYLSSLSIRAIIAGTVGGVLAALIFNDSGIVSAGTFLAYPWSLALLLSLESTNKKTSSLTMPREL